MYGVYQQITTFFSVSEQIHVLPMSLGKDHFFFEYSVANFAMLFALPTFGWFQILLCSTRCTRYVVGMSGAAVAFILHRMDTLVRRPNRLALGPVTEIGRPV